MEISLLRESTRGVEGEELHFNLNNVRRRGVSVCFLLGGRFHPVTTICSVLLYMLPENAFSSLSLSLSRIRLRFFCAFTTIVKKGNEDCITCTHKNRELSL